MLNSVDAGATTVDARVQFEQIVQTDTQKIDFSQFRLQVSDNGVGMSAGTILHALLCLMSQTIFNFLAVATVPVNVHPLTM